VPIGSSFDDFLQEQGMFERCTAAAIKSELQTAPLDATVAACLAANWDMQIASDLKAGKFNQLIAKAKAEMAAGAVKVL
jgi:hypothetical protein